MKKTTVFLSILITLFFSSCFSDFIHDGEGTLTIVLTTRSRQMLDFLSYEIKIIGERGEETIYSDGGDTFNAVLPQGFWDIEITAFLDDEVYATGSNSVEIKIRQNHTIMISLVRPLDYTIIKVDVIFDETMKVFLSTPLESLKHALTVTIHYKDGRKKILDAEDYELSGTLEVGASEITIINDEQEIAVFIVDVIDASVTSIAAVYEQGSTIVYSSATLDSLKANLTVTAFHDDGSSEVVTASHYTLEGPLTAGVCEITVHYSGQTATFNVNVTAVVLDYITISTMPTRVNYFVGDTLSFTGMIVRAYYNNGNFASVTNNATTSLSNGYVFNSSGTQTITVSYTDNGITKTVDLNVNVKNVAVFDISTALWSDGSSHADNLTTWNGTVLTVNNNARITVTGSVTGDRRIAVANSARATVTLDNVSITIVNSNNPAISLGTSSNLTLNLADGSNNSLTGGSTNYSLTGCAGISATDGTLTIGPENSTGVLTAQGGDESAGIGGNRSRAGGTIWIRGGTIISTGGNSGAGIGGGYRGSGGTITIGGGTITATGGIGAAGIGGGAGYVPSITGYSSENPGGCGTITINGGTITAKSGLGYYVAAIGTGGLENNSTEVGGARGTININGGTITASAGRDHSSNVAIGWATTATGSGNVRINSDVVFQYWGNTTGTSAPAGAAAETPGTGNLTSDVWLSLPGTFRYMKMVQQ